MKHPKPFIRILIFLAVLLVPAILWGITGLFGLNKYLDYDTNEKRNKHELAEDLSLGNLTSELEAYYNDRVPFRSVFLSVNRGIKAVLAVSLPVRKAAVRPTGTVRGRKNSWKPCAVSGGGNC